MPSMDSRETALSRIGRLSQLGGITPFVHADGKAKGTNTLRIRTACGLEFWIVPDRGMDIYEASFKGNSLCWHSPTGMVHPAYYSARGADWLKSFAGGLLTTCGLSTAGGASRDDGEDLGVHGPISNTPAENVSWSERWEGDDCIFQVTGKVRETSVHGPNLLLERTIATSLRSSLLTIYDTVENQGTRSSPLMILYHFNFGFPLLTPQSMIYSPSQSITPIDDLSAISLDEWNIFDSPRMSQQERVYFHQMKTNRERVTVILVCDHEDPDYGIALSYDPKTLPRFNQWKMTGTNHFVLGLEPANCNTRGREYERERGTLEFIEPGEKREFKIELQILESKKQVVAAIHRAAD